MSTSPYYQKDQSQWLNITHALLESHPLDKKEIVKIVLESWEDIFHTSIGIDKFIIGRDVIPTPQIMGFLLHEIIPLKLGRKYPHLWKRDHEVSDKDLVYIPDPKLSIEIKTSSQKSLYGNRSYAQEGDTSKKDKSGFYLGVNFEKFTDPNIRPEVTMIRFGWLDHSDWMGQASQTGQQSRLGGDTLKLKLVTLYKR